MGEGTFPLWTHLPIAHFRHGLQEKRSEIRSPSAPRSCGLLYLPPPHPSVLVPEVKPGLTPTLLVSK